MTKEDIFLPIEMGKLEIEPVKNNLTNNHENPFVISQDRKKFFSQKLMRYSKCTCASQKRDITVPIYKRKNSRIIKEPTLKLLQNCHNNDSLAALTKVRNTCIQSSHTLSASSHDSINLHTLVDNCNQLSISADSTVSTCNNVLPHDAISGSKWWKQTTSQGVQDKETTVDKSRAGPSCSQEALNPPCDVTIDELASYFETLVHIPKKMSSMAEMMYI